MGRPSYTAFDSRFVDAPTLTPYRLFPEEKSTDRSAFRDASVSEISVSVIGLPLRIQVLSVLCDHEIDTLSNVHRERHPRPLGNLLERIVLSLGQVDCSGDFLTSHLAETLRFSRL